MWFSRSDNKLLKENGEEETFKPMRIKKSTWIMLNKMKGYNGCKSFDDTINFLLLFFEENKPKEEVK